MIQCPHCRKSIYMCVEMGDNEDVKDVKDVKDTKDKPEVELPNGITKADGKDCYTVTGSKGDPYFVDLGKGTCNCPDATMRNKICKHIRFARQCVGWTIAPITAAEDEWFEKVGNETNWEDLNKVMGEKRIKELLELRAIIGTTPGVFKRLK